HDDIDVALLPPRHGLAPVCRRRREAESREHAAERLSLLVARRELDELHAAHVDSRRHRRFDRRARPLRDLVMEQLQRTKPVDGYAACGAGPETVVEDLERPITVVANA